MSVISEDENSDVVPVRGNVDDPTPMSGTDLNEVNVTANLQANYPPIAEDQSMTISKYSEVHIALKGTDRDSDGTVYELVSLPTKGVVAGFHKETGTMTYVPEPGFYGLDSFSFKVIDSQNIESNVAKVSIMVMPRPIISNSSEGASDQKDQMRILPVLPASNTYPISSSQTIETEENNKVRISLEGNDADRDKLTFSIVTKPLHGKLTTFDSTTGRLTFRPDLNFIGEDSFTFRVTDQKDQDSNIAKVSISMKNTDVDPSSNSIIVSSIQDKTVTSENVTNTDPINHDPSANAGIDRTCL